MNSPTAAGQAKSSKKVEADLVDAINQVFALFRVNYHNQYYKAFPETETLNITKKLWLESLKIYSVDTILRAGEQLVRSQDYLPTLSQMLRMARSMGGESLPEVHRAFVEACEAPSPKKNHSWSHPLVYHAGLLTGWNRLGTQPEKFSFPIFRKHFEQLEQSYLAGEPLSLPDTSTAAPTTPEPAVDAEEARNQLAELRSKLKI